MIVICGRYTQPGYQGIRSQYLPYTCPYFNFNSVQRALVLEDYAPALRVRGFVSAKKGSRSLEEKKEGKNNNNNN